MKTELYWIPGPWPGRLAILPRPRGGDWLEDEIRNWRREGVDTMLSLLTEDEVADLVLEEQAKLCRENGIEYHSFPIEDRKVPSSHKAFSETILQLVGLLAEGKTVAVHCRQGIGRAATVAIGILLVSGVECEEATERTSSARGRPVPETAEQKQWLVDFSRNQPSKFPA